MVVYTRYGVRIKKKTHQKHKDGKARLFENRMKKAKKKKLFPASNGRKEGAVQAKWEL